MITTIDGLIKFLLISFYQLLALGVLLCLVRFVLYCVQKYCYPSKSSDSESTCSSRLRCALKYGNNALKDIMLRISNFLLIEFKVDEETYKLFDVEVRGIVMQYVFLVIMINMAVSIISFWNVFGVDILILMSATLATIAFHIVQLIST